MTQHKVHNGRSPYDHLTAWTMAKPPDVTESHWATLKAAHDGDVEKVQRLLAEDAERVHAQYAYWQPLHFATRAGHAEMVRSLLDAGADPMAHIWSWTYKNPLEIARDRGHADVLALLEAALEERYQAKADRGKLICDAVRDGDVPRINALLDEDAELVNVAETVRDDIGTQKPLHVAVEHGRTDLVDLLLERGADIHSTRADGFKPIHVAIWHDIWWKRRDNWDMVDHLLAQGAANNICIAAARNDVAAVRQFLKQDRSLANVLDTNGRRPLSCAAERGHTRIVKLLIKNGADPNLPEANFADRGYALFSAVTRGHTAATKVLLEAGADVNGEFHASGTAAFWALGKNKKISRLLYRHGAVAGLGAACYWDRLDVAAEVLAVKPELAHDMIYDAAHHGKADLVRLAFRRGAQLDLNRVETYYTPIGHCLIHHGTEIPDMLLEHGDDLNKPNWFGQTPLHMLVVRDRTDMIAYALDHGADPNVRDWQLESTPLGWAARHGDQQAVELLIERGAKVNLPDDKPWNTPLTRAAKEGHTEIVDVLRKHGAR